MLLDVAIGIYSAIFLGWLFDFPPSFWFFIAGILMALMPDSDFLYLFFRRFRDRNRADDHSHRNYFHYPLIYLPAGTIIFYLAFGKAWAALFLLSSFLHFLHDSIAVGWGIKWLYPFSKNNFAFFYLYSKKEKRGLRKLVFSFDKVSLKRYVREHGDVDWLKNIYYKWHPIAVVEFAVFISTILSLLVYLIKRATF